MGGGAITTAAGVGALRGRAAISPLVAALALPLMRAARRRPGRATLRPTILSSCWINHGRRSDPPGKALTADHLLFNPLLSNNALAAARLPSWLSASACKRSPAGAEARLENRFRRTSARFGRSSSSAAMAANMRMIASPGHASIACSASGRKPEWRVASAKAASSLSDQMSPSYGASANRLDSRNAERGMTHRRRLDTIRDTRARFRHESPPF